MKKTWTRWLMLVLLVSWAVSPAVAFQGEEKAAGRKKSTPVKARSATPAATDDATIAATLKEKFAKAPSMKETPVNVHVEEGQVTLTGKAKTGRQKGTATRMAKAVVGVKGVENKMEVEAGGEIAPAKAKSKKSGS